jgi:hypothetical protein
LSKQNIFLSSRHPTARRVADDDWNTFSQCLCELFITS